MKPEHQLLGITALAVVEGWVVRLFRLWVRSGFWVFWVRIIWDQKFSSWAWVSDGCMNGDMTSQNHETSQKNQLFSSKKQLESDTNSHEAARIMGASCKEIAETLIDCIKKSDCVRDGSSIKDCLAQMKDNGCECQEFRNAYFTCKRGGLDMRTRIRGQKVYWVLWLKMVWQANNFRTVESLTPAKCRYQ